jgi:hypothetical protein
VLITKQKKFPRLNPYLVSWLEHLGVGGEPALLERSAVRLRAAAARPALLAVIFGHGGSQPTLLCRAADAFRRRLQNKKGKNPAKYILGQITFLKVRASTTRLLFQKSKLGEVKDNFYRVFTLQPPKGKNLAYCTLLKVFVFKGTVLRDIFLKMLTKIDRSWQCGGSGMFIPDPGSRIPDPKTAVKDIGEKKFVVIPFFLSHKFHKIELFYF